MAETSILSNHVLNVAQGVPAEGVSVELWRLPDDTGPDGRTPLMPTASRGAEEMAPRLLEPGAGAAAALAFGNGCADPGQRLGPDAEADCRFFPCPAERSALPWR